ncbi:hypothetical protein [Pseudomonas vranovensis]|uniref:hypothetical protein n=1 Tax=Pseudomonas vranovensis TaxID=321661 RepID=UPI000562E616|nr:hypothetical protein [Pseudomonas vranovensis]
MRTTLRSAIICSAIWSAFAAADPTYLEKMTGLPAVCTIDAMYQQTEVDAASRKYGEGSKRWSDAYHRRLDSVRACVDDAKKKGKALYKAEVERAPSLESELADMYASWLNYLDHLTNDDRDSHEQAYEASANRVKAHADLL